MTVTFTAALQHSGTSTTGIADPEDAVLSLAAGNALAVLRGEA